MGKPRTGRAAKPQATPLPLDVHHGEELLRCPVCGAMEEEDGYDVLGADGGKLFCNQCNSEVVVEVVESPPCSGTS